jgi:hypothetical protein
MAQRIYWVPHTICFFGCEHCHNDSVMAGLRADRALIERIVANLPGPDSPYRLEEVLVGGGEALMRGQQMEFLVKTLRARFPQGPQATVAERRAAGYVTIGLQTMGFPLADAHARPVARNIQYWLDLGVDHFHIASNDIFHERQRPDYDWEGLRRNLREYGAQHGVEFLIYGKAPMRLVPSGRVLDHLDELAAEGASLLTDEGYCAHAWEAGANFLSGAEQAYPECAEVVIDPHGWVHPCCWHELAPGLFNLGEVAFAEGIDRLRNVPFCQAIDAGDMIEFSVLSGLDPNLVRRVRDQVGDCGVCRLASVKLTQQPEHAWLKPTQLSEREIHFYDRYLGADTLDAIFGPGALTAARRQPLTLS